MARWRSWLGFDSREFLGGSALTYVSPTSENHMDPVDGMFFIEHIDGIDVFADSYDKFKLTVDDQFDNTIVGIFNP